MNIKKELEITGIRNHTSNTYAIELGGGYPLDGEKSFLVMDLKTLERFAIPLSPDLLGKALSCSFTSRTLPLIPTISRGCSNVLADLSGLERDDVMVRTLMRRMNSLDVMSVLQHAVLDDETQILALSSFSRASSPYWSKMPCPYYRVSFEISNAEYEECRKLQLFTVFTANFSL